MTDDRIEIWPLVMIFAILLAAIVVLVVACAGPAQSGPMDERFGLTDSPIASYVITDSDTGVYYLVVEHGGIAVTPLLTADGLPMMVDDANHDPAMAIEAMQANVGVE